MPARPIASASISFGLVSIPVKLFSAVSSQNVSFNMLHKGCGNRVKTRMFCPVDNTTVGPEDMVRGFEHARDQYVSFTNEELDNLKAATNGIIALEEFVPADSVDWLSIETSHYLGPDKNGDRAYQLLAQALKRRNFVAVGRHGTRGKDNLVIVRPYKTGLMLHQVYYADEVRSFDDTINLAKVNDPSPVEVNLADKLIEQQTSDKFDPTKYRDTWIDKVNAAVEQKVSGEEVTVVAEAPRAQIIDLLEALKRSVATVGANANDGSPPSAPKPGPAKVTAKKAAKKKSG